MHVTQPTLLERFLVMGAQFSYLTVYSLLYFSSPRTAHRLTGYLEEEAQLAYTGKLEPIICSQPLCSF